MSRAIRVLLALTVFALPATSLAGAVMPQDSGVTLVKTVGTDPTVCATNNILVQIPEDGIVYYCYKMTYTGTISASSHTLIDSVLGSVLDNIPGFQCCTDASATNCADPVEQCSPSGGCSVGTFSVCAATTYPGVCCTDEEGLNCSIPHQGCFDNTQCGGNYCVTDPIVQDGQMVTRVITATVSQGIANQATWTAKAGICCSDTEGDQCDGGDSDNAPLCATDDDCLENETDTCRTEGVGLCCDSSTGDCDDERVCLVGRECDDETFDECTPLDTIADAAAAARVGVVDTPALSAGAMALAILMLVGVGFSRLRRHPSL